ncbi:alpha/beta hydrolase family protein [Tuwongella immobilis]|nr:CocE/NonD family hydrolase [Tuwongella immobilis]
MRWLCWVAVLLLAIPNQAKAEYDPLKVGEKPTQAPINLDINDSKRSRKIPIKVYLPASREAAPVVLFSHGLGGSRDNGQYVAKHWSSRGYVVVMMQHLGSDESVWKSTGLGQRLAAMKTAASAENFRLRVQDVPAVIDQLTQWNQTTGHPLEKRMDLKKIGMSGHSFGAVTTQAVSGQRFPLGVSLTDPRITAALAMSPSTPKAGNPNTAFGSVSIPWLLMTGTNDTSPINDTTVESRMAVYPALPKGSKYELVLEGAEHSAFSDRGLLGDRAKRNPNHHRAILALSTAFWDAYLTGSPEARAWLDSDKVRTVLETKDRWQRK